MKKTILYLIVIFTISIQSCKVDKTNPKVKEGEIDGLNYVEGTLDEALAIANEEGKYLFVVSVLEGCNACDNFLVKPTLNDRLKEELSDHYLIYKCDFLRRENRYLSWIFNSVASPTGFVFSPESKLINIVLPNEAPKVIHQALELGRKGTVVNSKFSKRISLVGKDAVIFFNQVFQAQQLIDKGGMEGLREAYFLLRKSIATESYFYNNYLCAQVAKRLELYDDTRHYMKQVDELDGDYNRRLYNELY
ncbi:hypothetical protein [Zhouia amylolytica]|uniref:Uncharacterized protein n=1 Tax=Zhouia amylolytica AD3 TaxID=1286632 RepID=W2UR12_9FLAO|nr:hypothetical protein [Zhouia amylolytica]ETN96379.1 hypothetical protein P278_07230 [Zhouia amylolytica AD3]